MWESTKYVETCILKKVKKAHKQVKILKYMARVPKGVNSAKFCQVNDRRPIQKRRLKTVHPIGR